MSLNRSTASFATAPLLLALAGFVSSAVAQVDARIENQELKTTLQISAAQIQDLGQKLSQAQAQLKSLSESLAHANSDGQQAREALDKLRVQMEGLGIAALDTTHTALQQRLLTALSDLRILEGHRRVLTESLVSLSEAVLAYARNTPGADPAGRESLNKALATAERSLSGAKLTTAPDGADQGSLNHARIVSLKEDLGVAVLSVGSRHGVHPGMSFGIWRQDKPVARALVVDVRQGICGAVVQELVSKDDPVKVGDTGRVETSKG